MRYTLPLQTSPPSCAIILYHSPPEHFLSPATQNIASHTFAKVPYGSIKVFFVLFPLNLVQSYAQRLGSHSETLHHHTRPILGHIAFFFHAMRVIKLYSNRIRRVFQHFSSFYHLNSIFRIRGVSCRCCSIWTFCLCVQTLRPTDDQQRQSHKTLTSSSRRPSK